MREFSLFDLNINLLTFGEEHKCSNEFKGTLPNLILDQKNSFRKF